MSEQHLWKDFLENLTGRLMVGALEKTPERFCSALDEMTSGQGVSPSSLIVTFPSQEANEMVVVTDIEFFSVCEHHLLPFFGRATIGYIPSDRILGLSKAPRIVTAFARRLQTQEFLTTQIADCLFDHAEFNPKGVGVHLQAQHLCAMARGVRQADAVMHTTALRGCFHDADVKQEFLSYRRHV